MTTTKLVTTTSLNDIAKNLLNANNDNREIITSDAKDSLLQLFASSIESHNITPLQWYNALIKTDLNSNFSPHDEFLAINNNGKLDFIKPHHFTQEQKTKGRKIIEEKDSINLQQIIEQYEKTIEESSVKNLILDLQDQVNQLNDLLNATKDFMYNEESNVELSDYLMGNQNQLLHNGILSTQPTKKTMVGLFALTRYDEDPSIEKIIYDITLPDQGRMLGFNDKALFSTSEFYTFSARKLKNFLTKELQKLS